MNPQERELTVLHFMPDLAFGGGQQVLLRHVPHFIERGVKQVIVYFESDASLHSAFEAAGARTVHIPYRGPRDLPRMLRGLTRLVADENVDILHTNGTLVDKLAGHLTSVATGKPMVTTLHGVRPARPSMPHRPSELREYAAERLGRRLELYWEPRTLNQYVAVSDAVRESWQSYLDALGVPSDRIRVIYSGVPVEMFASSDPRAEARVRKELALGAGPVLVSIGRFHRGKNLHVLLDAVARLKSEHRGIQLLLVGDGYEEDALRAQTARLNLEDSVRFVGPRRDVGVLLRVSDVLVFPSGQEGFGLVVIEALAAGIPVVTTRLPSLRRLWSADLGIELADSITPEAIAVAIDRVLSHPAEAAATAHAGQTVVREEWSASASASKYVDVYHEIKDETPGFRR